MGTYLGVRAVEHLGRPTNLSYNSNNQPLIPSGKRLIAVMNNGLYKIAPDVTRPSEYKEFYDCYAKGIWIAMHLYLLEENEVTKCPDEGRVYNK